jgi:phosphatidate cytidylyltransferase
MNNFIVRSITGFFFVSAIVCSIWFNVYVAIAVFTIFFVAALLEYLSLFKNNEIIQINKIPFLIINSILFAFVILCLFFSLDFQFLFLFFPFLFLFFVLELWRKKEFAIINIGVGVFGFIYLFIPFSLILVLLFLSTRSFPVLIGMFLLIWTNDTFAYLTGRFIGKNKLIERISPKKTWEGTFGGVIFTLIVSYFISFYGENSDILFWIISAIIITPCAILGDLLESLMKRNLKIKDSGSILPGHGGILDRFDATLFTVPFYFTWVIFYKFLL